MRSRRFLLTAAVLSALAEPAGAVVGLLVTGMAPGLNDSPAAFAAGAMVFVSLHELVPMVRRYGGPGWFGGGMALSVVIPEVLAPATGS